ncbi:MAG: lytic transglycosylase F [Bacteroidota bacterium]
MCIYKQCNQLKYLVLSIAMIIFVFSSCRGENIESDSTDITDSLTTIDTDSISQIDSISDVGFIHRLPYFGDLDSMISRRFIRVLVPNNRTHYFLDGGQQRGMVYEYINAFENHLNKKLKRSKLKVRLFCIPVRRDQLIPQLINGYGDMIAAGLTRTEDRALELDFTSSLINGINEVIVSWKKAPALHQLHDLSGKTVYVRKSSTYYQHLQQLNLELKSSGKKPVRIYEADENLETEDILELVNHGTIQYTIADDYLVNIWSKVLDNIVVYDSIPLHKGGAISQAVRKDSPNLKKELNLFIKSHRKGTLFGNVIFNRYMKNTRWVKNPLPDNYDPKIERFMELFKTYGDQYDLNHIFLLSLAFQESRLNNGARSHAGAVGIMQIRPTTASAKPIYIKDITKLENNIHAGTKYLRHIMDTYFNDPELPVSERMFFTMAAYNAGPHRISVLRKKAAAYGYDPKKWFDNVEIVVAKSMSREPIQYINNIVKNYVVYNMMKERLEMKKRAIDKIK